MAWDVGVDPAFDQEFDTLSTAVQDELLAQAKLLEAFGPALARPRVDTLKGSRHANMKELRFQADARFDTHLDRLRNERKSGWQP